MAGLTVDKRPTRSRWASPVVTAVALAGWNLFVWGGRIRNLVAEPGGLLDANRGSLVGSVFFCALALLTLGVAFVARDRLAAPAVVLAVAGIVVWAYRAVVILTRDYSVGFMVVHTLLALVTIGLGALVICSVYRSRAAEPASP